MSEKVNGTKKISVVIPTYGRAQIVCVCVKSVWDAGYSKLEIIVADDSSPIIPAY